MEEDHDGHLCVVTRDRLLSEPVLITRRFKIQSWAGSAKVGEAVSTVIGEKSWSNGRVEVWTGDATITETPIKQPPRKVWRDGRWCRG